MALLFQALLFGDGGVLAYGVNVVNMAIIMPFVGFGVYRLIAGQAHADLPATRVAAAVGGYVGINAAALAAAIELGIQPDLFHAADGAPLYSPYHLAQTIPAMMLGAPDGGRVRRGRPLTAGVLAYLQRANLPLLQVNHPGVPVDGPTVEAAHSAQAAARAWSRSGAVAVMVVLTPLGPAGPGRRVR